MKSIKIQFKFIIVLLILLQFNDNIFAQIQTKEQLSNDFEKFKNSTNKEFQNYKDERDKEFADLLKQRWIAFNLEAGNEPKKIPVPPKLPEIIPEAPKQDDKKIIPTVKVPAVLDPKYKPIIFSNPNISPNLLPLENRISFYNNSIPFNYEKKMLSHCTDISEKGVSEYWNELSNANYIQFIDQIKRNGSLLQLNDWGYYDLISKISSKMIIDKNDQTLFCFFMLSHLDFDVKVAKRNNDFILLIPFKTTVYKKSYINIDNIKYYIIGEDLEGQIYTFKQKFSNSNKSIDLSISKDLKLGNDYSDKTIYFKKINKDVSIKVNPNLIAFYNQMPMSDLTIFFNSKFDPITENSLISAISPLIENKNELEAVNIILEFVQKSFEYKTDVEQFGYEKFYFPEDMFYYPFSDCEDRSILFSHLVKSILKLDVIGLEYSTHAACAVKFNTDINGDAIILNEKKYIICDPTYIGASAGMAMPQFLNEKPKIIKTTYN